MSTPLFRLPPLTVAPQGRIILQTDTDTDIPQGGHTAVIGPNGAGKSTLLKALLGRFGCPLSLLGRDAAPQIKAGQVAWVAQNGHYNLPMTVREYTALGRRSGGLFQADAPDHGLLDSLLRQFDLGHLAGKRIDTLSGGEQQRANIVRALMQQAAAVLLDEPCNHLDIRHQHQLMHYLHTRRDTFGAVMVLHDLNLAAAYADHIILMNKGRIVAQGGVDDVMQAERLSDIYQWPISRRQNEDGVFFTMRPIA